MMHIAHNFDSLSRDDLSLIMVANHTDKKYLQNKTTKNKHSTTHSRHQVRDSDLSKFTQGFWMH